MKVERSHQTTKATMIGRIMSMKIRVSQILNKKQAIHGLKMVLKINFCASYIKTSSFNIVIHLP